VLSEANADTQVSWETDVPYDNKRLLGWHMTDCIKLFGADPLPNLAYCATSRNQKSRIFDFGH